MRGPIMHAAMLVALATFWPDPARAQGMSVDEYERMFAPAPQRVSARMRGGTAMVAWSAAPAPPKGRLAYDRALSHYRVYRLVGGDRRVIGETRSTSFADRAPPPGPVRYVVTAIRGSGQEGARSEEAPLER